MKKIPKLIDRILSILIFVSTAVAVTMMVVGLYSVLANQCNIYKEHKYRLSPMQNLEQENFYTEEDVQVLGDLMYVMTEGCFDGVSNLKIEKAMKLVGQIALNWKNTMSRYEYTNLEDVINSKEFGAEIASKIGNVYTPREVYLWAEEVLKDGNYAPSNLMHVTTSQFKNHEEYARIGKLHFYLD